MATRTLSATEIEDTVKNFKVSTPDDIGSLNWFKDVDKLYKLYQFAGYEGNTQNKGIFIASVRDHKKVEVFVNELITLSVWKENVLPEALKLSPQPQQVFPASIILYSEGLLVELIQTLLFHDPFFRDRTDLCIDVIDYSVAQLTIIDPNVSFCDYLKKNGVLTETENPNDEIMQLKNVMDFALAVGCVPLLRYIVDNFDNFPLSVASRVYKTYDLPLLIARIIEEEMLTQKKGDTIFKYDQSKWMEWKIEDPWLSSTDCQVWLLMKQLLMNSSCNSMYYFSKYRKKQLLKLFVHLNDQIIQQLTPLYDLKVFLKILASTKSSPKPKNNSPLLTEVKTQFRDSLCKKYDGKWSSIAHNRSNLLFHPKDNDIFSMAEGFVYRMDGLRKAQKTLVRCTVCFKRATNRCSKCKDVWYCSRQCQENHWQVHKKVCGK